jgi:hypothetical protein
MRHLNARVLPIILYHDGVNVGNYQNVTSVLGTCGNYSDEMQRMDKAKFSLGFITNLDMLKLPNLLAHLKTVGFTKTAASNEIRLFALYVNQQFWKLTTKSIQENYEDGVKLLLLGDKVYQFIPVVPFMVGDDPAQHLVSGVMNRSANRSCINCMFRQKDHRKYDKRVYPDRDAADITAKCAEAEAILDRKRKWELQELDSVKSVKKERKSLKFPLRESEKAILESLGDLSIVPMINAFHSVYMGASTSIYDSPPDPFHVFCAGLMKSAVLWIMIIIVYIADITDSNAIATVDQRLHDYPYTPLLPHLVKTFFTKGLTSIAARKSKDEKAQATGSGQGYRSSWWITALIQLFFCIGYQGDVLPNTPNYMAKVVEYDKEAKKKVTRDINLGNPTSKVLNAIYHILNAYFECKRTSFTNENIDQLETAIKNMNIHFDILWDLKQALIDSTSKKHLAMQKNHTVYHLVDSVRKWGSASKINTDRYESAHNSQTTSSFKSSCKRIVTLVAEMLQININKNKSNHMRNLSGILEHGAGYQNICLLKSQKLPEYVTFAPTGGMSHWKIKYSKESNLFELVPSKDNDKSKAKKPSLMSIFSRLTSKIEPIQVRQ